MGCFLPLSSLPRQRKPASTKMNIWACCKIPTTLGTMTLYVPSYKATTTRKRKSKRYICPNIFFWATNFENPKIFLETASFFYQNKEIIKMLIGTPRARKPWKAHFLLLFHRTEQCSACAAAPALQSIPESSDDSLAWLEDPRSGSCIDITPKWSSWSKRSSLEMDWYRALNTETCSVEPSYRLFRLKRTGQRNFRAYRVQ